MAGVRGLLGGGDAVILHTVSLKDCSSVAQKLCERGGGAIQGEEREVEKSEHVKVKCTVKVVT